MRRLLVFALLGAVAGVPQCDPTVNQDLVINAGEECVFTAPVGAFRNGHIAGTVKALTYGFYLNLTFTGDLDFLSTGFIDVRATGYDPAAPAFGSCPAPITTNSWVPGGAFSGCASTANCTLNTTQTAPGSQGVYGNIGLPASPGSPGCGVAGPPLLRGGEAGGAVGVFVAGTFSFAGTIDASGNWSSNVAAGVFAGGGSGGSVTITAGTLDFPLAPDSVNPGSRTARIVANGGEVPAAIIAAAQASAGTINKANGGSGGRIAIHCNQSAIPFDYVNIDHWPVGVEAAGGCGFAQSPADPSSSTSVCSGAGTIVVKCGVGALDAARLAQAALMPDPWTYVPPTPTGVKPALVAFHGTRAFDPRQPPFRILQTPIPGLLYGTETNVTSIIIKNGGAVELGASSPVGDPGNVGAGATGNGDNAMMTTLGVLSGCISAQPVSRDLASITLRNNALLRLQPASVLDPQAEASGSPALLCAATLDSTWQRGQMTSPSAVAPGAVPFFYGNMTGTPLHGHITTLDGLTIKVANDIDLPVGRASVQLPPAVLLRAAQLVLGGSMHPVAANAATAGYTQVDTFGAADRTWQSDMLPFEGGGLRSSIIVADAPPSGQSYQQFQLAHASGGRTPISSMLAAVAPVDFTAGTNNNGRGSCDNCHCMIGHVLVVQNSTLGLINRGTSPGILFAAMSLSIVSAGKLPQYPNTTGMVVAKGEAAVLVNGPAVFDLPAPGGTIQFFDRLAIAATSMVVGPRTTIASTDDGRGARGPGTPLAAWGPDGGFGIGGAHAGCGAMHAVPDGFDCTPDYPDASAPRSYGSVFAPFDTGSKGGESACVQTRRPPGGGAVRVAVSGLLSIDGKIVVNGSPAFYGGECGNGSVPAGAGSGGSLFVTAGMLAGAGSLQACGGDGVALSGTVAYTDGETSNGYPGSGGRIAVYATSFAGASSTADHTTLPLRMEAFGGGFPAGTLVRGRAAAGSIYVQVGAGPSGLGVGTLWVNNNRSDVASVATSPYLPTFASDNAVSFAVGQSALVRLPMMHGWYDVATRWFGIGNMTEAVPEGYPEEAGAGMLRPSVQRVLAAVNATASVVPLHTVRIDSCQLTSCAGMRLYAPSNNTAIIEASGIGGHSTTFSLASPPSASSMRRAVLTVGNGTHLDISGMYGVSASGAVALMLKSPLDPTRDARLNDVAAAVNGICPLIMPHGFPTPDWDTASFSATLRNASNWRRPATPSLATCISGNGSAVLGPLQGRGVPLQDIVITVEPAASLGLPAAICLDATALTVRGTVYSALLTSDCPAARATAPMSAVPGTAVWIDEQQSNFFFDTAVATMRMTPGVIPSLGVAGCTCASQAATPIAAFIVDGVVAQVGLGEVVITNATHFVPRPAIVMPARMFDMAMYSLDIGRNRMVTLSWVPRVSVVLDFVVGYNSVLSFCQDVSIFAGGSIVVSANARISSSYTACRTLGVPTIVPAYSCRPDATASDPLMQTVGAPHAGCDARLVQRLDGTAGLPGAAECRWMTLGSVGSGPSSGCDGAVGSNSAAGAALTLNAGGDAIIDGVIDVSATPVVPVLKPYGFGGASAGGVYVDASSVLGTGRIMSNGGDAEPGVAFGGMGGSGGRIALRCKGIASDRLPAVAFEATGGRNGNDTGRGAAGTIYNQNCGPTHLVPLLTVDNGVTTATVDATSSGVTLIDSGVGTLKRLVLAGGGRVALVDLGNTLRFSQRILALVCNRTAAQTSTQAPPCLFEITPRWNQSTVDFNVWTLSVGVVHGMAITVPANQLVVLGMTHIGSTLAPAPGIIRSVDPLGEAATGFGYLGVVRDSVINLDDDAELMAIQRVTLVGSTVINDAGRARLQLTPYGPMSLVGDDAEPLNATTLTRFMPGTHSGWISCNDSSASNWDSRGVNGSCYTQPRVVQTELLSMTMLARPGDCWAGATIFQPGRWYWSGRICSQSATAAFAAGSDIECPASSVFVAPAHATLVPRPSMQATAAAVVVCGTIYIRESVNITTDWLYVGNGGSIIAYSGSGSTGGNGAHAGCTGLQGACSPWEGATAADAQPYGTFGAPSIGSAGPPEAYGAFTLACMPGGSISITVNNEATVHGTITADGSELATWAVAVNRSAVGCSGGSVQLKVNGMLRLSSGMLSASATDLASAGRIMLDCVASEMPGRPYEWASIGYLALAADSLPLYVKAENASTDYSTAMGRAALGYSWVAGAAGTIYTRCVGPGTTDLPGAPMLMIASLSDATIVDEFGTPATVRRAPTYIYTYSGHYYFDILEIIGAGRIVISSSKVRTPANEASMTPCNVFIRQLGLDDPQLSPLRAVRSLSGYLQGVLGSMGGAIVVGAAPFHVHAVPMTVAAALALLPTIATPFQLQTLVDTSWALPGALVLPYTSPLKIVTAEQPMYLPPDISFIGATAGITVTNLTMNQLGPVSTVRLLDGAQLDVDTYGTTDVDIPSVASCGAASSATFTGVGIVCTRLLVNGSLVTARGRGTVAGTLRVGAAALVSPSGGATGTLMASNGVVSVMSSLGAASSNTRLLLQQRGLTPRLAVWGSIVLDAGVQLLMDGSPDGFFVIGNGISAPLDPQGAAAILTANSAGVDVGQLRYNGSVNSTVVLLPTILSAGTSALSMLGDLSCSPATPRPTPSPTLSPTPTVSAVASNPRGTFPPSQQPTFTRTPSTTPTPSATPQPYNLRMDLASAASVQAPQGFQAVTGDALAPVRLQVQLPVGAIPVSDPSVFNAVQPAFHLACWADIPSLSTAGVPDGGIARPAGALPSTLLVVQPPVVPLDVSVGAGQSFVSLAFPGGSRARAIDVRPLVNPNASDTQQVRPYVVRCAVLVVAAGAVADNSMLDQVQSGQLSADATATALRQLAARSGLHAAGQGGIAGIAMRVPAVAVYLVHVSSLSYPLFSDILISQKGFLRSAWSTAQVADTSMALLAAGDHAGLRQVFRSASAAVAAAAGGAVAILSPTLLLTVSEATNLTFIASPIGSWRGFDATTRISIGGQPARLQWLSSDGSMMTVTTPPLSSECLQQQLQEAAAIGSGRVFLLASAAVNLTSGLCGYQLLSITAGVLADVHDLEALVAASLLDLGALGNASAVGASLPRLPLRLTVTTPLMSPAVPRSLPPTMDVVARFTGSWPNATLLGFDAAPAAALYTAVAALSAPIYFSPVCAGNFTDPASGLCTDPYAPEAANCAYRSIADGRCYPCSSLGNHALCPGGPRLRPKDAGYWTPNEYSGVLTRCPPPSTDRCVGFDAAKGAVACGFGYRTGTTNCQGCLPGFFLTDANLCEPCPSTATPWERAKPALSVLGGFAGVFAVMTVVVLVLQRQYGGTFAGGIKRSLQFTAFCWQIVQTIVLIGRASSANLPTVMRELYSVLNVFQFDAPSLKPSCSSSTPLQQQEMFAAVGIVLALVVLLLLVWGWLLRDRAVTWCLAVARTRNRQAPLAAAGRPAAVGGLGAASGFDKLIVKGALLASAVLFGTITHSALSMLTCSPASLTIRDYMSYVSDGTALRLVGVDPDHVQQLLQAEDRGEYLPAADTLLLQARVDIHVLTVSSYVVCGESRHIAVRNAAIVCFALFSILLPIVTAAAVYRGLVFHRRTCTAPVKSPPASVKGAAPRACVSACAEADSHADCLGADPCLDFFCRGDFRASSFAMMHLEQLSVLVVAIASTLLPSTPSTTGDITLAFVLTVTLPIATAILILSVHPHVPDKAWTGHMYVAMVAVAVLAAVLNAVQFSHDLQVASGAAPTTSDASLQGLAITTFTACMLLFAVLIVLFFYSLIGGAKREQQAAVAHRTPAVAAVAQPPLTKQQHPTSSARASLDVAAVVNPMVAARTPVLPSPDRGAGRGTGDDDEGVAMSRARQRRQSGTGRANFGPNHVAASAKFRLSSRSGVPPASSSASSSSLA